MKNEYRKCFKIIYDYIGCAYTDQDGRIIGKKKNDRAVLSGLGSFIGIICLNSLLQILCGVESVKEIPLNGTIEYIDTFMLTMAMTALGAETSLDKFKQAGAKPFLLAGLLYVWLVGGGYLLAKYLVPVLG